MSALESILLAVAISWSLLLIVMRLRDNRRWPPPVVRFADASVAIMALSESMGGLGLATVGLAVAFRALNEAMEEHKR